MALADTRAACGSRAHARLANLTFVTLGLPLSLCVASSLSAAPSTYELNPDHTDVTFQINHAGFTMKHGSFAKMSGNLKLDPDQLAASSVDITVAVESIETNHDKRDQDLRGPQWLDSVKYPYMHFVSTKVLQVGPKKLDVIGTLSLHGVTKAFVLHAIVNRIGVSPFGNVPTAGFSATGTLKRSEYGLNTFLPVISDDVKIEIEAEFAASNATKK